jgi:hypothetical protein
MAATRQRHDGEMTTSNQTPKNAIRDELERIEEDCIHSGKAQFKAHDRWSCYHYWLGIPAVVLSRIASISFFQNIPELGGGGIVNGVDNAIGDHSGNLEVFAPVTVIGN